MSAAMLAPDFLGMQALILYYARKELYHHVATVATTALQKRANDASLLFWRAYATLKEGHLSDAVRELDALRSRHGVQLPALICLKQAHDAAELQDREAIDQVKKEIYAQEEGKNEGSFFVAAQVCMLQGEHKKARKYLESAVAIQANYPQAKSLSGWIELRSGSEVKAKKALDIFNDAKEASPEDIDAMLGHVAYLEVVKKDIKGAIDMLTTIAVNNKFSWFTPAEAEKARLLLLLGEWESAAESTNRALQIDPNSVEVLSLSILVLLAKDSKYSAASPRLGELIELINETEPHNARLCHDTAALFCRLCARNGPILAQCLALMTKATQIEPRNSVFMTELAYQRTLATDYRAALDTYAKACSLDEANMTACYGKIVCQILGGAPADLDDARAQVLVRVYVCKCASVSI